MEGRTRTQPKDWVAALKNFMDAGARITERCELCSTEIGRDHPHLIEPATRQLSCVCQACALLFDNPEARRYRRVPGRVTRLPEFDLADAQWDALLIPINIAFFFHNSPTGRVVAFYPGPAGATESTLTLTAWAELAIANPVLNELQADVEALLVNRMDGAREYFRTPIDRCYGLVGLIRQRWQGLSGGEEARDAIQQFFSRLRSETDGATINRNRIHA
ncbi:DUF5947 family protein [Marinobacter caseinilyticus]|uniref:DUF5947 family protein n=1 Tax=Marinobacter caseinilyticus TaxID=2692195 RepID=UPI001A95383C|nr:DUF5947 family protein [Marinobacter caseinilyticus]